MKHEDQVLALIAGDIERRIGKVCAHLPSADLKKLCLKMARVQRSGEQSQSSSAQRTHPPSAHGSPRPEIR